MSALRVSLVLAALAVAHGCSREGGETAAGVWGDPCAVFASVVAARAVQPATFYVSVRLFDPAYIDPPESELARLVRSVRGRGPETWDALEDGQAIGGPSKNAWRNFEAAARDLTNASLVCDPEDFASVRAGVYSPSTGEVRFAEGRVETLDRDNDWFRDEYSPNLRRGSQWAFSAPGVSANELEAVVYARRLCGNLCGDGSYYLLRRDDPDAPWRVVGYATMWVS